MRQFQRDASARRPPPTRGTHAAECARDELLRAHRRQAARVTSRGSSWKKILFQTLISRAREITSAHYLFPPLFNRAAVCNDEISNGGERENRFVARNALASRATRKDGD